MASRRDLIFGAATGLLGVREACLAVCGDHVTLRPGYGPLIAYCMDLDCPEPLRNECLRALPTRTSPEHLASLILSNLLPARRLATSAIGLSQLIREAGQSDFKNGRVSYIDGWILSLTETRVYALSGLLIQ